MIELFLGFVAGVAAQKMYPTPVNAAWDYAVGMWRKVFPAK